MFDARPILAGIWRRIRAHRTPVADITAKIDALAPEPRLESRPVRPQTLTSRVHANVLEPHSWDVDTRVETRSETRP